MTRLIRNLARLFQPQRVRAIVATKSENRKVAEARFQLHERLAAELGRPNPLRAK